MINRYHSEKLTVYIKTLTLFLGILFITACGIKITPNLFTTDEYMVVTYSTQGCFSHSSTILVFHEDNVTIYETKNQWGQKVAKSKMGTLLLTTKDKERLNNLFAYYNDKLDDGCTSVDEIEIKRYKKEELIFTKNIRDGSCGLYEREDILSFSELIYRERKQK